VWFRRPPAINLYYDGISREQKMPREQTMTQLDQALLQEFSDVENILENCFKEHIALKGRENKWHKVSRQIWDFT
jgi:flagellar biosynthesis chaperone FliJ